MKQFTVIDAYHPTQPSYVTRMRPCKMLSSFAVRAIEKMTDSVKPQQVTPLAEKELLGFVKEIMSFGPKHCVEPNEGPVVHVATVRKVAHEATHEEKERSISKDVD